MHLAKSTEFLYSKLTAKRKMVEKSFALDSIAVE